MSVSAASYLVGNRVYNGGTNNPTSGTVDPSGYIQRNISQKRSGLAAIALRNLGMGGTNTPDPTMNRNPVTPPQFPTNPNKTVVTSSTGRLILTPSNDPTSTQNVLPYDEATGQQQVTATKGYADKLDAINVARNLLQQKVAGQEHTLDMNGPSVFRNLLNNYAAHGMAHSSGYGYGYGQAQDAQANQRAALESQLQEGLAGYDQQQQSAGDDFNMLLAQLAAQSASNSAANGNASHLAPPTPTSIIPPAKVISKPVTPITKPVVKPKLTPTKTKAVAKKIVKRGK